MQLLLVQCGLIQQTQAQKFITIKFFDGSDDISFATFNQQIINFIDSAVASDLVNDTSPQLGGDLDTNSFNIR